MAVNDFLMRHWIPISCIVISLLLLPVIGFGGLWAILVSGLMLAYQIRESDKNQVINEKHMWKEEENFQSLVHRITLLKEEKKLQKILQQVRDTITQKRITLEDVLHKLRTPLHAIIIQKYFEPPKLIVKKLNDLGFRIIGTGVYILPPNKCPKIDSNFDIAGWVKKFVINDLPEKYKFIINFAAVVDLRQVFATRVISKKGRTIYEVLEDAAFLPEVLLGLKNSNVTISEIIKNADITFLIESLPEQEMVTLKTASSSILSQLKCTSILDIQFVKREAVVAALEQYSANATEAAAQLRRNAEFWTDFIATS